MVQEHQGHHGISFQTMLNVYPSSNKDLFILMLSINWEILDNPSPDVHSVRQISRNSFHGKGVRYRINLS
jgi:hypothetical protein